MKEKESIKFKLRRVCGKIRCHLRRDPYFRLQFRAFMAWKKGNTNKLDQLIHEMVIRFPDYVSRLPIAADILEDHINTVKAILGENATHEQICKEMEKRYPELTRKER